MKWSTYCLLLLIKMLSLRFCAGIDFLKPIDKYIVSDDIERGANTEHSLKGFRTEHGSSQGQNLALTGLYGPHSLDSVREGNGGGGRRGPTSHQQLTQSHPDEYLR